MLSQRKREGRLKLVESLISQLDKVSKDADSPLRVFPLKKANAQQVATTLEELYQSQGATAVSMTAGYWP